MAESGATHLHHIYSFHLFDSSPGVLWMQIEIQGVEFSETGKGRHMRHIKRIAGVPGKAIYVRTASGLGILLENVLMILCATIVASLGTWLLTVTQKQCVGTAKNQGICLPNARINLFATPVGRWVIWLVNVQNQAILEFAAIVSSQAIWQQTVSMKKHATSAVNLATLLVTVLMSPFATSAI